MDSECTDSGRDPPLPAVGRVAGRRRRVTPQVYDRDRRFVQAAEPDPAVVLPDPGDHVVAVRLHVDVVHDRAAVVQGLDPDGPLGLGLEHLGDPGHRLAEEHRAFLQPLHEQVGGAGDRHPDQPVGATGDVVGVAGQVPGEVVAGAGLRAGEPVSDDGPRTGLGDGDVRLVLRERDAVGEGEPVEDRGDRPVRVAAQQPAGPGVLDEVGLPVLDAVLRGRVGEPHRAVARDGGVVAEDHPDAVDAVGHRLHPAGAGVDAEQPAVGVADQQPPVEVDLDAERAAAGLGDPVDLGAVGADPPDRAVLGAGEDRPLVRAVGRDDDVLGARAGDGHDLDRRGGHPVMLA